MTDKTPPWAPEVPTAMLVLADGTVIEGRGAGAAGSAVAEVCFNTALTGYQEILTDPSYAGQIVTFTFPHIGNVGTNSEDLEDLNPAARHGAVGALFAELEALGVYDRAVVVLLSDHGEGLGDHGEGEHGVFLYREALQVPLLLKLPGARLAGATIESPAQLIDVAPTLLALLGIEAPANLRGRSLLELDAADSGGAGTEAASAAERHLYAETYYPRLHLGWSELRSMIAGNLHFIEAPSPELYDLAADPGEREVVLEKERSAARALRAGLEDRGAGVGRDVFGDLELAERAAALGVRVALGHALAVERRELLDEVAVVQRGDAVGADRQRVRVAGDRGTCLSGGCGLVSHERSFHIRDRGLGR